MGSTYSLKQVKWSFSVVLLVLIGSGAYAQRGGRGGGGHPGGGFRMSAPAPMMGMRQGPFGYSHYYRPYIGLQVSVLPAGYYSLFYGPNRYFYYDGFFYSPYDEGYRIVAPPLGAELKKLPRNAEEIRINGVLYYVSNGVYYQPIPEENGKTLYRVVGKDGSLTLDNSAGDIRIGDIVQVLPEGSQAVEINNQRFYVSPAGFYYEQAKDDQGTYYRVVGKKD